MAPPADPPQSPSPDNRPATSEVSAPSPELRLPWVESPFFEDRLEEKTASGAISAQEALHARFLHENGYLVLENAFPEELVDRVRSEVEALFAAGDDDPRRAGHRFQDAWKDSPAVREMATYGPMLGLLERLYGRRPVPFQTLNFSHGSEQRPHADTIHFSSLPQRFLAGVWVALEDVGPDNGTLCYYPGSHRLPEYGFDELGLRLLNYNRLDALEGETYADYDRYEDFVEQLMEVRGLEREELTAKKGTALVWSANLVHGGVPVRREGATRWSQVTHVYFDDCVYLSPLYSNPATGDLYLKRITDLATGEPVRHVYRGLPLPDLPGDGVYKLMLDREDDGAGGARDVVRVFSNRQLKHMVDENRYLREVDVPNLRRAQRNLEQAIREIESSPSLRIGRAVTAPGRWLKRLLGRS